MQDKPVILINGSGGVGKDTFIDFCKELVPCFNISTVDKVKEAAGLLGWDGSKAEKDRRFLSDLKCLSSLYSDHSYQYIKEKIEEFQQNPFWDMMFFHSREPEEIQRFKELGCATLLITNNNVAVIQSNMADANVLNFIYDHYIDNSDSLEHLKCEAINFSHKVLAGHKKSQRA